MPLSALTIPLLVGTLASPALGVGFTPPSKQPHGGGSCSSDWDCSLGGLCSEGTCACDPWFTGPQCGHLNLKPVESLENNGLQQHGYQSWGGHCAWDSISGKYVALFSFMLGHCDLWSWTVASAIVMAEAAAPEGPYTLVNAQTGSGPVTDVADALVLPPYSHNAMIVWNPAESVWLLWHIGSAEVPKSQWCNATDAPVMSWSDRVLKKTDAESPTRLRKLQADEDIVPPRLPPWAPAPPGSQTIEEDFIGVAMSASPRGPWSATHQVEFLNRSDNAWVHTVSNPAPFIFPNGTTLLFGKGLDCPPGWGMEGAPECLLLFRAPTWRGPYELLTPDQPLLNMEGEDPGIFQDPRGNFHLLSNINTWHKRCPAGGACGGHSWSRDGLTWSENLVGAYGPVVELANGSAVQVGYVERPQVYQDANGVPTTFFVGLTGDNYAGAMSWAQPFVTAADLPGQSPDMSATSVDAIEARIWGPPRLPTMGAATAVVGLSEPVPPVAREEVPWRWCWLTLVPLAMAAWAARARYVRRSFDAVGDISAGSGSE